MLLIRTSVKPSPIAGLGCFTDVFIPRGTEVWRKHAFDIVVTDEDIRWMPYEAAYSLKRFWYVHPMNGVRVLCCDNARYFNHSYDPNVSATSPFVCYALRDTQAGEELTNDYRELDIDFTPKELLT